MRAFFYACRFLIICGACLLVGCEENDKLSPCMDNLEELIFQIDENSPAGAVVGVLPTNELSTTRYVIASGNFGNTFSINPVEGKIIVSKSRLLDFEKQKNFELSIIAYGPECTTTMAKVMIQIGDLND
jgi:hypothetical protein